MSRAFCFVRHAPAYRRDAFLRGLKRAGFDVADEGKVSSSSSGDLLVIWNRYSHYHEMALAFERRGGTVLVAENGYVGVNREDRRVYALARGGHNGSGEWRFGGPERWQRLGVELKPWQRQGGHVLVCPNRSFGMPGFIMPPTWTEGVVRRLQKITKRPVLVRPHPGNDAPKKPLAADLLNAWAVVIWSSSAGCQALIDGIPVFSEAPWWILAGAAERDITNIDRPQYLERLPSFERLAWAQWNVEEIESGDAFLYLLDRT